MGSIPTQVLRFFFFFQEKKISGLAYKCYSNSSSFVEAVESVVVEAVDCCRLLYTIESSSFV